MFNKEVLHFFLQCGEQAISENPWKQLVTLQFSPRKVEKEYVSSVLFMTFLAMQSLDHIVNP